jgi:hypothetical protein
VWPPHAGDSEQIGPFCAPSLQCADKAATIQNGSFARLSPAPTTLCYLRLSATTAMDSSVASVARRSRPERAALNEVSAPVITIYDVPHRGMSVCPIRVMRVPLLQLGIGPFYVKQHIFS